MKYQGTPLDLYCSAVENDINLQWWSKPPLQLLLLGSLVLLAGHSALSKEASTVLFAFSRNAMSSEHAYLPLTASVPHQQFIFAPQQQAIARRGMYKAPTMLLQSTISPKNPSPPSSSAAQAGGPPEVRWQDALPLAPLSILLFSLTFFVLWGCASGGAIRPILSALLGGRAHYVTPVIFGAAALLFSVAILAAISTPGPSSKLREKASAVPSTGSQGNAELIKRQGATAQSTIAEKQRRPQPKSKPKAKPKPNDGGGLFDPAESSMLPVIPLAVAAMFFLILLGFVTGGVAGSMMSIIGFVGLPAMISAFDYDENYGELQGLGNVSFRSPWLLRGKR